MTNTPQLDIKIRQYVYETFLKKCRALQMAEIAGLLGYSKADVQESFERLSQGHILVLQPDSREILMANPFSAVPTAFQVESGSNKWWGNCIWDGLGILAMLRTDGRVRCSCQDCGEELILTVQEGEMLPTTAVAHFSVPASQWWENIVFT